MKIGRDGGGRCGARMRWIGGLVAAAMIPAAGMAQTVSPMSLSFGDQPNGIPSQPQELTVTNNTAAAVSVSASLYGNNNQPSFSPLSSNCRSLAIGAQCTIMVTFTPRKNGALASEVAVISQPGNSKVVIPVSGTGVTATQFVTISPTTSLSFGNQPDGTASPPQTVTITNTTAAAVTVSVSLYGNNNQPSFSPLSTDCAGSLAVEATCTVNVTFTPQNIGVLSSELHIASDQTSLIPMSGVGVRAKYAYASDNTGGTVYGFSIGPTGGTLTALASSPTTVSLSGSVLEPILGEAKVDPSGSYLYVVDAGDNYVWGFAINQSNGALTPVPQSPFATGDDPVSLAFDSTGSFLYVANQEDATLSAYTLDKSTGQLSSSGTYAMGAMGQLPDAVPSQMMQSGSYLYIADEGDSVVDVFQIKSTGALLEQQNYATDTSPYSITANPAGTVLYTANIGSGAGSISAFTIASASGTLGSLSSNPQAIAVTNHISIDPQGRFLFVTESAGIAVYSFAATGAGAGALSAVNGGVPVAVGDDPNGPYSVFADPTDQALYVGSTNGSATQTGYVWEFTFDSTSGALTNIPGETTTGEAAGWNPLFFAID
jgi:6-phosphogluconolactonase (cycloisomerase 2 family)